jgi:hypothetical protein
VSSSRMITLIYLYDSGLCFIENLKFRIESKAAERDAARFMDNKKGELTNRWT